MSEKTIAQKKAQQKYMDKFAVARVRMEHDKYDIVQAHAESHGESVNAFINRAIDETIERDKEGEWPSFFILSVQDQSEHHQVYSVLRKDRQLLI